MRIKIIKSDRSRWYQVGDEMKCERIYKNGNAIIVDNKANSQRLVVEYGHYEISEQKHFKRGFVPIDERILIEKDFEVGMSYYDVSRKYDITTALAHSILEMYKRMNSVGLGFKNETYLSEEEMLQGYKIPTFEELSESEKTIYSMK